MVMVTQESTLRLFLECDMEAPECVSAPGGNVVAFGRTCPSKCDPNDDSAAILVTESGAIVLAVADGVGGSPLGHKASEISVRCVTESVLSTTLESDLRPAILDGIENANAEILAMGIGAATTITVVEIQDRVARGYQVGDSMAVIVGQRGTVKWRSTAHSPVGYAIESGMLCEEEAMHHDERHLVSNLVGSRSMHIEVGPTHTLAPRDTVVLGSDGLFDNLHLSEVADRARIGHPMDRMRSLVELADARMSNENLDLPGKPDDLTVLLYTP